MLEIEVQRYMIDVVKERGGAGHKMSHKFNMGVCDLLLKFPRPAPAVLFEVKNKWCTEKYLHAGSSFELAVTRPQREFLSGFYDAGMKVGVVSFLQWAGKSGLAMGVFQLDLLKPMRYHVLLAMHEPLGKHHKRRDDKLYDMLLSYANGDCKYA